jgi:hypothetical protein
MMKNIGIKSREDVTSLWACSQDSQVLSIKLHSRLNFSDVCVGTSSRLLVTPSCFRAPREDPISRGSSTRAIILIKANFVDRRNV